MRLRILLSAVLVALVLSSGSNAEAPSSAGPLLTGQTATPLTGDRWLLIGGQSSGGFSAAVVINDPATGTQTVLSALRTPRAGHSATVLPDGSVLIVGGVGPSGAALAAPELIDVAAGRTSALDDAGLLARTGHTATLLTDGRVLVAGGRGSGTDAVAAAQLWDPQRQEAQAVDTPLAHPRTQHTATLLADGSVLLWGGRDAAGAPLGGGEIFDPQGARFRSVSVAPTSPLPGEAPQLAGAAPAHGADNVPLEGALALRFSKPLRMDSITPTTVSLHGPDGPEAATLVIAEQGSLVFVTPDNALTPGTEYTVNVNGVVDVDGQPAAWSSLRFTTRAGEAGAAHGGGHHDSHETPGAAHSHAPAVGPYGGGRGETDDDKWKGETRDGKPYSHWQALPPLQAPDGVTALAGQVLRLNGQPLANVTMRIGRRSARTDDTGRFLITEVGTGYQILIMDGSTANAPGKTYGTFDYGLRLAQGTTTVLPFTVWMPLIDTQHATEIPVPTTKEIVATTPRIPDLEIRIPADVVLQTTAGPLRSLTITRIPHDRAPIPSPPGATLVFTPQAHGAAVLRPDGTPSPVGVRIILPNPDGLPAGTRVALWSYSAWQGGWYEYGHGTVSADARQIVPDAGVDLKRVTCYFSLGLAFTGSGPIPGGVKYGDPVDLATGFFTHEKTDLVVPDVIPIVLKRAHRPGDPTSRQLGSSNFEYQMYLTGDMTNFTWAELILADGGRIHYDRISGTTQYDSVFEHTATPTRFYKSRLAWSTGHGGWAITFTNGIVYEFLTPGSGPGPMLQAIRDRAGNRLTITRAAPHRRILRIVSPNGRWVEFAHTPEPWRDLVTQIRDNSGRTVTYEYGENDHLTRVTDPAGGVTEYTYTAGQSIGQLRTIKDARGIVWLTITYDANNRVSRQTAVDGTFYDFAYTLDASGKVTQTDITNPRGYVRRVAFNAAGYPLTDTLAYGTAVAQTTIYVRDSANRVTSMTDAMSRTTTYTYDTAGNALTVTRLAGTADAVTTTFTYEPMYNQVATVTDPLNHTTTFGYDGFGNVTSITNPLGQQTTFTYKTAGQPLTVTTPAGTTTLGYEGADLVSITDPNGNVMSRFTDAIGRLVKLTDSLGRKTQYTYDSLNQITQVADPLGGVTQFGYDANGNVLSVTDARSNATTYGYDNMDRVTSRTDPLLRAETYGYDNSGNRTRFTDRKNQSTVVTYDALDRLTLVTYADDSATAYTYDAGNRVTQIVDSFGGNITFTYDGLDRLLTESTALGTVTHTYDAAGRRTTTSVPGQTQISYGYDNANRLTSITQGTSTVSFAYDNAGRRTSHTLPNGIVTEYAYDAASQLTGLTYKLGGNTLGTLTYAYNGAGQRAAIGGTWARTGQPTAVANATYDVANHQLTFGSQTLTYDLNGSLTSDGTNTYNWDARNRLSAITGATPATFVYDALGRRKQKTISGTTTDFLYDGLDAVQEQTGSTTATVLIGFGIDERFVRSSPVETGYLLADALGSTVALSDGAGTIQTPYSYEAFGLPTASGTGSANSYTYTGRENDGTGLYYYRARYYHPGLSRFISEDPLGFAGGDINLYAYALNAPTVFRDPSGLAIDPVSLTAAGIMCGSGAVVGAAMAGPKASWGDRLRYASWGCAVGMLTLVSWVAAGGAAAVGAVGQVGLMAGADGAVLVGTSFGQLGRVVENPGLAIRGFQGSSGANPLHGLDRAIERGVNPATLVELVRNPSVVLQQGSRYLYLSPQGAMVLDKQGQVVTVWGAAEHSAATLEVLKKVGAIP